MVAVIDDILRSTAVFQICVAPTPCVSLQLCVSPTSISPSSVHFSPTI
jgi:hypothetical protein